MSSDLIGRVPSTLDEVWPWLAYRFVGPWDRQSFDPVGSPVWCMELAIGLTVVAFAVYTGRMFWRDRARYRASFRLD